ncbi:MAG TPA: ABC transporter permease, partial [Sphingobacteriaceae bacterium]
MFQSYFKIGWRNLLRNKSFSLINISGLAIGMAVAILIGLWVISELSFNRSFSHYKRIYSVYHHLTFGSDIFTESGVSPRWVHEVRTNFPEFEKLSVATYPTDYILTCNDKKFSKPGLFVEPQFIDIFSLKMIHGTAQALNGMHSIVLSKSFADITIGENPLGKTVKFDNRDDLVVTGVYEDFPVNSEFSDIQMLMPMEYYYST